MSTERELGLRPKCIQVALSLTREFTPAGSGQLSRLKAEAIITLYGLTVSDAFKDMESEWSIADGGELVSNA